MVWVWRSSDETSPDEARHPSTASHSLAAFTFSPCSLFGFFDVRVVSCVRPFAGRQRLETLRNSSAADFLPREGGGGDDDVAPLLFEEGKGDKARSFWPAGLRGVPKVLLRGINDSFWDFFTSPDGPWVHVDEAEAVSEKRNAIKAQEVMSPVSLLGIAPKSCKGRGGDEPRLPP